jgi:ankyrin repeat protein
VVELLIAKGANIEARDKLGRTPMHDAVQTPLDPADRGRQKEIVEILIAQGADVKAGSLHGNTPLHEVFNSMGSGINKDVFELLLAKGADIEAGNDVGNTPLFFAAGTGEKEAAEFLIAKGADVNAKNIYGGTPLHHAAQAGQKEVVELLLENGARVNAKDREGDTPLNEAEINGHKEAASLLISRGAKTATTNVGLGTIGLTELLFLLGIPFLIAFVDVLRSDFSGNNKIVWLIAVLVPLIGPIAYFFIGRKRKAKKLPPEAGKGREERRS